MLTNLFSHILTVSMSMAVVIAAAFVLMHLFGRNFAARTRYLVWTILILRLCIPVGTMMVPPLFTLEVAPQEMPLEEVLPETAVPQTTETEWVTHDVQQIPAETRVTVRNPVHMDGLPPVRIPETEPVQNVETTVVQMPAEPENLPQKEPISLPELWNSHILPGICAVWVTVAFCLFLGQLHGYLRLMSSMHRTMLVADPETKTLYQAVCEEMHIRRPPKLAVSALAGSPMVCGFFRPMVVLPDMELDSHALRGILTHELTHYRRGDVWRKLAALFARSLHWFNPLVHMASARFMSDMEMACDEAALQGMDEENRRIYGMVMLDIVKRCHLRSGQLTTRFNPRKGAVMERFRNIMDTDVKKRGWWIIGVAAVLCLGAGVFVACEVKPMETEETQSSQETEESTVPEEVPVEEETEEIPVPEEIPVVEVIPEEPDAEAVLPPDTENAEAPELVPVEGERTKYALEPEKDALVYTGYRVDYNAQMHMTAEYSRWYVMELPQIVGEDEWNRQIADKYFRRYGSLIGQLERADPNIYKFFSVSYEVILWNDTCTIAIRHHGGSNASGAVGIDYDIHHYNRKTGEFLSTDEFLALYTDGKWNMNKLMILANGYGFSRDEVGNIWEIPEENFQGVIPSANGNGLFDLCYQGISYEGAIASRVMVADYKPYETTSYQWTDLGGGTHTTKAGQEYFWLATNVDAGYRLSVNYPLVPTTEYAERHMITLDITLAPDCSAPQITFSEEAGRVFLHLTGETLDGAVQDKIFLCREPESSEEWFEAYARGWIGETQLFLQDYYGWTRNTIMDAVNRLLETYAAGGDVSMHMVNPENPEEAAYPFIPVRTAVDWNEMNDAVLPGRKKIDDSTWLLPVDLGSGYTMEVRWGIGGMGDSYTGAIESVRITTGEDPITAWRPNKGDGLLFAEEFGDTGEWLLSYTSADGQPALYKAYYTDSGKAVHEPQVLGTTRFDNARAIGARYTDGKMLVLIEAMDREETEIAYVTFTINTTEKKTVIGAADLLDWWMNGAPVRFPNHNMPHSGDTVSEIAEIPVTYYGGTDPDASTPGFVQALLTNDREKLAELTSCEPEMYDNLYLACHKYMAYRDPEVSHRLHFVFYPEERSVMPGMQSSWNHYIVEDGMYTKMFLPIDRPPEHYTGAAAAVAGLLNSSLLYEFPKSNDMDKSQREYVTDYILSRLWQEEGSTAEEIAAYAKTYLGIPDFTPADSYAVSKYVPDAVKEGEPERYMIPAHGGWSIRHRIESVTENSDGTVEVRVQFYADHNRLVPSHHYTYTMREVEGEWAFAICDMTRAGKWEPKKIAV